MVDLRILANMNAPEAYVSALRGDGHDVASTREVPEAVRKRLAMRSQSMSRSKEQEFGMLSIDIKDFENREFGATVSVVS